MIRRRTILTLLTLFTIVLLVLIGYGGWNMANPVRTCSSCHEIASSVDIWQLSAHREVKCADCHGTALSNGLHSLREKSTMLFSHISGKMEFHTVGLDEHGVLEVMEACIECHKDEYSSWKAGGHSATYGDIFLNEKHNSRERLYPDCFRCHGMFYDGSIGDLVEPISTQGPWKLKDPEKFSQPVIPCLTCHPIHMENMLMGHPGSMEDPGAIFYEREQRNSLTGLYLRSDRIFLRSDMLRKPDIFEGEVPVLVSDDPVQLICMQCHSPNWSHQAGSEDDRTPTGVHEGISCMACHQGHSNNARNACNICHPAVTSCGLDVKTMNTSYLDRKSPHNIHSMQCTDCHDPIP